VPCPLQCRRADVFEHRYEIGIAMNAFTDLIASYSARPGRAA